MYFILRADALIEMALGPGYTQLTIDK